MLKEQSVPSVGDEDREIEPVKRRRGLDDRYDALPAYGSVAYWKAVEAREEEMVPLEVLVRCVRDTIKRGDDLGRKRLHLSFEERLTDIFSDTMKHESVKRFV